MASKLLSNKVQVPLKACVFGNFNFAKEASSAEVRVKDECLHDQLTLVFAVLANHPMLTMKVKYACKVQLLIGLKSDFIWTYLVWGVCYFCPCSVIVQRKNQTSD